jgi:hypothetical protein
MPIKTILACVSSAEASATTLEVAFRIARQQDAHIEAIHVRADPRGLVPYTGEGMDGSMIEEIMEVTEKEGGERAELAKGMFDAFCRDRGIVLADRPNGTEGPTIWWREEVGRERADHADRARRLRMLAACSSVFASASSGSISSAIWRPPAALPSGAHPAAALESEAASPTISRIKSRQRTTAALALDSDPRSATIRNLPVRVPSNTHACCATEVKSEFASTEIEAIDRGPPLPFAQDAT